MYQGLSGTTVGKELGTIGEELGTLAKEVSREATSLPRITASGWSGPASLLCNLAVELLRRELDAAHTVLFDAQTDIESAAFEVEHHA